MPEAPESQPEQAAPAAPQCPPQAPEASEDRSKFTILRDGILNTGNGAATGIRNIDEQIRTALRYQLADQEEYSLIESPFAIAGSALDATAGNIARRALDVAAPIGNAAEAAVAGTVGAVLQPIKTLSDPVGFLKKPLKIITSLARAAGNAFKIPIQAIHDIAERGLSKNLEIVRSQIAKIPLLGPAINITAGKVAGFFTKIITSITGAFSKVQNTLLSPVDAIDEAVKI